MSESVSADPNRGMFTRDLSDDEIEAFAELGLRRNFWEPLYVVPVALAWRRGSDAAAINSPGRRRTWSVWGFRREEPDPYEKLTSTAAQAAGLRNADASFRQSTKALLERTGSALRTGRDSFPDLHQHERLALDLLAWHLAIDYPDDDERNRVFSRLRSAEKGLAERRVDTKVTDELYARFGDLLGLPSFAARDASSQSRFLPSIDDFDSSELDRLTEDLIAVLAEVDGERSEAAIRGIRVMLESLAGAAGTPDAATRYAADYLVRLKDRVDHRHATRSPAASIPTIEVARAAEPQVREMTADAPASIDVGHPGLETPPMPVPARPRPAVKFEPPIVQVANPFRTMSWSEVSEQLAKLDRSAALSGATATTLFARPGQQSGTAIIVRDSGEVPTNLWFIGDLHGDLLTLANAWQYIHDRAHEDGGEPHILFLGDFVDRTERSHETVLWLFELLREHGKRICVLPGNHDADLRYAPTTQRFVSTIDPAEYVDELNRALETNDEEHRFRVEVGKVASEFFAKCPRAVILPDGLMLAHAGFPHADMLERFTTIEAFDDPSVQDDLIWLRVSGSPWKRPNRARRGCDFGYRNFDQFSDAMHRLGVPVNRLLRGHDHLSERYGHVIIEGYPAITTINTMGRWLESEWASPTAPLACIARYVPGQMPEIHRLPIDPREVSSAYPSHG